MSTTTNLKLFKHDNPTTNTNQFDVEKALNENWDKLDANAGEIANKIQALENTTNAKDTSQDTEIEVLKAENALLKSQIPSATVVGKTIHLEDSSNMQCQISPIGASKQETTIQSANLFDKTKISTAIGSASGYVSTEYIPAVTGDTIAKSNATSLFFYDSTKTQITNVGNWTSKVIEVENVAYVRCNVLETDIDTFMLVKNQDLPSEYVEFVPNSPSIEYEAPIESVGDNINLFDKDNARNGYYSIYGGALTEGNANWYYCVIKGAKNTELTLSGVSAANTSIGLVELDGSKSFLKGLSAYSNKNFTTSEECEYIGISCRVEDIDTLKLEKGSKATQYSPYGQGSIEIYNCNENLAPKSTEISTNGGLTYTPQNDGSIKITGTATGYSYYRIIPKTMRFRPTRNFAIYLGECENIMPQLNGFNEQGEQIVDKSNVYFVNVSDYPNVSYWVIDIKRNSNIETNTTVYPMVYYSESNDATDYIENQSQTKAIYTQQPFRAIGDVKDRFVKQNGVWYEEHNVDRYILDGTTNKFTAKNSSITSDTNGFYLFKLANKILGVSGSADYGKCNYLQYIANNKPAEVIEKIGLWWEAYDGSEMNYASLPFLTLEEANAWMMELYNAGTPLYIDYVLAEPLLIPCTPEQVEVLESFNTYKNVTNISSDSIGELEVTYSKDLETLYNNLSQAVLGGN